MVEVSVIDEPAAAIAAGRCVTARSLDTGRGAITAQHPRRCAWCDYPLADLSRMVEGWNHWADGKDHGRSTVYARHDAQLFAERSRRDPVEAERLIVDAQGLEPLPVRADRVGGSDPLSGRPDEDRTAATFPVGQVQTIAPTPQAMEALPEPAPLEATAEEDVSAWM